MRTYFTYLYTYIQEYTYDKLDKNPDSQDLSVCACVCVRVQVCVWKTKSTRVQERTLPESPLHSTSIHATKIEAQVH